jgi:hypothetical protein
VRPVAHFQGGLVENLDIHVSPAGDLTIGFALANTPGAQSGVTLAQLPAGQLSFDYDLGDVPASAASFGWDALGATYFAAVDHSLSELRVGQDVDVLGGLTSSPHPFSGQHDGSSSVALAVDQEGFPAIAGVAQNGQRFFSHFDVKAGSWGTERVGTPGYTAALNQQAVTFDSQNRPTLSFVEGSGALKIARRNPALWQTVEVGQAESSFGTTLALDPAGGVGFAYSNSNQELLFGSYDATLAGPQVVSAQGAGLLTPRSLAYDAQSNPALVFSGAQSSDAFHPLHLARRDALGQWMDEILPVDALQASLTFDAAGYAYIAAVTETGIALISQNIAPLAAADFNRNGHVDAHDLAIWQGAYGLSDLADADEDGDSDGADLLLWQRQFIGSPGADFNGDDNVDSADLAIWHGAYGLSNLADADGDGDSDGADFLTWQRNWTAPMPPPGAASVAVPEPASLLIAWTLGAILLVCGRRANAPAA